MRHISNRRYTNSLDNRWHERAPPPVSGLMAANSKTIKHEEVFYEKKWNFTPSDHPFTMAPRNYEYPFNDTLQGGPSIPV
jgi:hypothetical protein